jgi:IclR family transcriptional regulator, acetate operon repressor
MTTTKTGSPDRSTDPLSSIDRSLNILEACARVDRASTITEIARSTGIPKSSVHRLCGKLAALGALTATSTGFTIGVRVLALGGSNPWLRFLRTEAAPILHSLAASTGLVANLALLADLEAVIIDEVFASSQAMPKEVGRRLPLHASAVGKALLMNRAEAEFERMIAAESLATATGATLTTRDALWEQVSTGNDAGFVISVGEWKQGRFGVAAPVISRGSTVASIGLVGLSVAATADGVGASVAAAAKDLSSRLSS